MDRRSWPWKRKSSSKSDAEKTITTLDSSGVSGELKSDKDYNKKPTYVQISTESYTHLTKLEGQIKAFQDQVKADEDQLKTYEHQVKSYKDEVKSYKDQVKAYEDQVKTYEDQFKTLEDQIEELNEKLSDAHTEISSKEELVKQHSKVAEEAVAGWEKAETEANNLKTNLEEVTRLKFKAEDKVAHLDAALKECMRQIRNLTEEHERKIQDVVLAKNKHCDNIKREFEARLAELDHELIRAEAENDALSGSLQERSTMLIRISNEKSQADAEIELLKSEIESREREISSLKYEVHIASKEAEIRNEEKNMSVKSAEAANKQYMEGVKKIAKLEAECQRLRGLVRKKLPGPAALAQMKIEVENLGKDFGETPPARKSATRPSSPHHLSTHSRLSSSGTDFANIESAQKLQKENDFLNGRLLAVEEETKILKEALAKSNSELQTSRSMYAKTATKLHTIEAQLHTSSQGRASSKDGSSVVQNTTSLPSTAAAVSEDANDDVASVAELSASACTSEPAGNKDKTSKTNGTKHLELMDDFLEMEKLARLSNDSSGSACNGASGKGSEVNSGIPAATSDSGKRSVAGNMNGPEVEQSVVMKVRSRISKVLESISDEAGVGKLLEEIKYVVKEVNDNMPSPQHSVICVFEEKRCSEDAVAVHSEKENGNPCATNKLSLAKEVATAISQIHTVILFLGEEAKRFQGSSNENGDGLNQKIELFSASYNKVLQNETNLEDFVLALSDVLAKAHDLNFDFMANKGSNDVEASSSPDCIDKIALPENKTFSQSQRYFTTCSHGSDVSSNPEVPQEANIVPGIEKPFSCSLEEYEQMKAEKEKVEKELARYVEDLETVRSELHGTEQLLGEVNTKLSNSEKMNSLSDTQLKCMAESYKSLEKRAEEFEAEVNLLRTKVESLEAELESEKASNFDVLNRCKELEEELQRNQNSSSCSCSTSQQDTNKSKHDRDLVAAEEKLAECQETIFLLGKQLKSFRPELTDHHVLGSPQQHLKQNLQNQFVDEEEGPTTTTTSEMNGGHHLRSQSEVHTTATTTTATKTESLAAGAESPPPTTTDLYNTPFETDADNRSKFRSPNAPRHRPTKSGSSNSSTPTPEKQGRGFSRFFSSKGRSGHY